MLGIRHLALFVTGAILLNVTPGQDTLYIVARSVAQGRGAGVASVLGISSGSLVHTLCAALGLSAILATSATAYQIVKYAGAAYLVCIGLRMLTRRPGRVPHLDPLEPLGRFTIYRQGVLTNVLNPKVAMFFLAFLPQFMEPSSPNRVLAMILLGLTFITTGTLWCLVLAHAAGRLGPMLVRGRACAAVVGRVTVALLVGLGVKLGAER